MTPSPIGIALFAAMIWLATRLVGGPLIGVLRRLSVRQHAYEDAPKSHAVKTGTPTMGGLLFVPPLFFALAYVPGPQTLALFVIGAGCALVGFYDDYVSVRRGRNRGLRPAAKFGATAIVALLFLLLVSRDDPTGVPAVVTFGSVAISWPLPLWYLLGLLAILGTTHAVNLTDGLDGLAGGTMLPPLAVVAAVAWAHGLSGVTVTLVALAASIVGFLSFNRYPARIFMGDTGALALGGVLAGSAILAGITLVVPIIGGVFVAETVSVIVQVFAYKTTRKRIFRMSPLHHHFELGGWPETKVTARFWAASAILSAAGAALVR